MLKGDFMKKSLLILALITINISFAQTQENINISIGKNAVGINGPWWLNNLVNPSGTTNNNTINKNKAEDNKKVTSNGDEQLNLIQEKLDKIVENTQTPKSSNSLVSNNKESNVSSDNSKLRTGQIFDENLADLQTTDIKLWNKSTLTQLNNKIKSK
jgi:hypothetical protein